MKRITLLVLPIFLAACSTSVVSEEERALPTEPVVDSQPAPAPAPVPAEETDPPAEETANPLSYEADLSQSLISFVGSKGSLVSHEGKFENYEFSLTSDDGIANASIELNIDLSSMVTDSDRLTEHLQNEDFFDGATHPKVMFTSTSIAFRGNDVYAITGDLTIKGVTKSVTINSRITDKFLTASYDLDRTVFGVGGPADGVKGIDAAVPVEVKIVFK